MNPCPYCAQTETRKDQYGYCKVYDCLGRSGKRDSIEQWRKRVFEVSLWDDTYGQVSGPVSNFYNQKTRKMNELMYEINRDLGFLPLEIIDLVPMKNREKWDKNIRW